MKRRCLISVYDKEGIIDFAKRLAALDWEIISTGNTKSVLAAAGVPVIAVEEVTNFPEILNGRVKTLSPYIFGGLLFRRSDAGHVQTIEEQGIQPIDMVVNTLYPFVETVNTKGATEADIIEKIDVGGPSMIRAAAKNYQDVLIITNPEQYESVLAQLEAGEPSPEYRKQLAADAFAVTAAYDAAIAMYFQEQTQQTNAYFTSHGKGTTLRYGENPHQKAWYFESDGDGKGTFKDMDILQGKQLSYNNYNDAGFAIEAIKLFTEKPTAVAIKHANPCGISSADTLLEAFARCRAADPESIFGGIVALNREVDELTAAALTDLFLEIVIAPSYTEEALQVFTAKKNLRVLRIASLMEPDADPYTIRQVPGGLLVQEKDRELYESLTTVTQRDPSSDEMADLEFAWKVAKLVKSNGIVIAKNETTLGLGLGEVNRYWAIKAGIERAGEDVKGAVCASDAFFPFSDSIEALADAGITAVIQPGGSIKDEDSIRLADERGIAMVFTQMRHFRH